MNENLRRIITSTLYSALFILIPIATIALVSLAQGYRFDIRTGQVVSGGLVQLGSEPRGASISVDGDGIGETTPERLVLPSGEYEITMSRDGFRQWRKDINVLPSGVTWVQYPVLLPNSISTDIYKSLSGLSHFTSSPDGKFIAAASRDDNGPKVEVLEANKPQDESTLAYRLPAQLRGKATISRLLWADDSEHLLVELKQKDSHKQILVDAVGDDANIDITSELRLPLTNLAFDKKNWRELYWLSPQGLRRLDMGDNTVSAVLAANVLDFTVTEEGVFMIRKVDDKLGLYQLRRDGQLEAVKDDFNAAHKLANITYLDFDGTRHLAVINRTQQQITLVSGVGSGHVSSRDISFEATQLLPSPENQYLLARNGGDFASYDLDLDQLNRFSLGQEKISQLSWYDPFHLLATADGSVVMLEFDGGNQENIVNSVDGFTPFASEDGKLIYSIGRSSVSSELIIHVSRVAE